MKKKKNDCLFSILHPRFKVEYYGLKRTWALVMEMKEGRMVMDFHHWRGCHVALV